MPCTLLSHARWQKQPRPLGGAKSGWSLRRTICQSDRGAAFCTLREWTSPGCRNSRHWQLGARVERSGERQRDRRIISQGGVVESAKEREHASTRGLESRLVAVAAGGALTEAGPKVRFLPYLVNPPRRAIIAPACAHSAGKLVKRGRCMRRSAALNAQTNTLERWARSRARTAAISISKSLIILFINLQDVLVLAPSNPTNGPAAECEHLTPEKSPKRSLAPTA